VPGNAMMWHQNTTNNNNNNKKKLPSAADAVVFVRLSPMPRIAFTFPNDVIGF
jgi:hypothetical protein